MMNIQNVSTVPGGCSTPDECFRYCSDPANWEQCGKSVSDIEPQFIEEKYYEERTDGEYYPLTDEPYEEYREELYRDEPPQRELEYYEEPYDPVVEPVNEPLIDSTEYYEPPPEEPPPEPTQNEGQLLPEASAPSFFGLIFLGIQNLLSL